MVTCSDNSNVAGMVNDVRFLKHVTTKKLD